MCQTLTERRQTIHHIPLSCIQMAQLILDLDEPIEHNDPAKNQLNLLGLRKQNGIEST